ncbi:glycosyltransferase [Halomonas halodenitrificans]|uniref:glycosyltransferase n=1 Tax=Halomonas halodenitrificans TaxID=28252 RepID=UPI000A066A04|nr:glycosyltransferase [Halomonas halodenitrificans]
MSVECFRSGDVVPQPPEPRSEEEIIAGWSGDADRPALAICCIVYNHAEFIADALNGFLSQVTDFPFSIIIHDDASTDGTQDIIKKYGKNYPKIIKTILQEENQYSKGRRALSFFQGVSDAKYLAVCEGDDYWLDSTKLKKQVDYLEKHPECVITGHDAFITDETGLIVKPSKLPDGHKRDYSSDELAEGKAWILTMSWVYRNVVEDFAPERNMVRNGDNFLTSILGQYGGSHYHHDIKPAAYRVHAGGVWSSASEDKKQDDQINTWFWMYRYYKRIGKPELAGIYFSRFQSIVFRKSSFLKLAKASLIKFFMIDSAKVKLREMMGPNRIVRIKRLLGKI